MVDEKDGRPPVEQGRVGRGRLEVPRWVKVFAAVALALALLLLAHMLIGGGAHGPSLHGSGPTIDPMTTVLGVGPSW